MSRKLFFIALCLPLLPVVLFGGVNLLSFVGIIVYAAALHVIRGRYVGLTPLQSLAAYFFGTFSNNWNKIWRSDKYLQKQTGL